MKLDRRQFLKASSLTLAAYAVSTGIQGCASVLQQPTYRVSFNHGVASGDPLADRVIIWTRVTPQTEIEKVEVMWQAATDPEFTQLVREGVLHTSSAEDYTVKVDLAGLSPATHYYYRFLCAGEISAVGRTKTLPVGQLDALKLAFFSCSNYPGGYFNAYADAAKRQDLDVALHLGDYIYEYGDGGYATKNSKAIGRALPEDNDGELFKLVDYRKRYALYRTDRGSQALHGSVPFIVVWDDHEVANDTWKHGAQNHNEGEGDFGERKLAALQAYFEWMPIRPVTDDNEVIYRSFDFGDLVSLHMLDTRIVGREERYWLKQFSNDEQLDVKAMTAAINAPERQILGAEQFAWLKHQMETSTATWQILGQQLLMARMHMPAVMLSGLYSQQTDQETFERLVKNTRRLKAGDPSLTEAQKAEVNAKIPYNLDAWDGYASQRNDVLQLALQLDKRLLVVAGDTHNAWASVLTTNQGDVAGAELGTTSVSSPGMETYLGMEAEPLQQFEQVLPELIDDLQLCQLRHRGYTVLNITPDVIKAEWVFIEAVDSEDYQVAATQTLNLSADEMSTGWQIAD